MPNREAYMGNNSGITIKFSADREALREGYDLAFDLCAYHDGDEVMEIPEITFDVLHNLHLQLGSFLIACKKEMDN